MGLIESGRAGAVELGAVRMTYYESYILAGSNYVATIDTGSGEDQLSFVGTDSTTSSNTVVAGALWLFNDGTTPIPSMVPQYSLHRTGIPVGTYQTTAGAGAGIENLVQISTITAVFDPALVLTLANLEALTQTPRDTIRSIKGGVSFPTLSADNSATASDANAFTPINTADSDVFGVAIYFRHFQHINVSLSSFTLNLGNKDLRVIA